jgi:broad specificity phosphatase PhoE
MRHGAVAYFDLERPIAPDEVRLTPAGVEQARAAGRALAEVRFDRVITTGLGRTVQTAELVVGQLATPPADADIESVPDLREFHAGDADVIPDHELERAFLEAFSAGSPADASFLGGETVKSLVDRVAAAMERIYADDSWHTLLIVAHGGVNRAILSAILAGPGANFGHLEQYPACINIIDGGPEFVVRAINVTPYDPAHLGPRITTLEDMLAQYRDSRRNS